MELTHTPACTHTHFIFMCMKLVFLTSVLCRPGDKITCYSSLLIFVMRRVHVRDSLHRWHSTLFLQILTCSSTKLWKEKQIWFVPLWHLHCSYSLSSFSTGRGLKSHAYIHSVQFSHHVFLNLHTLKFYCLPDNYEIIDSSLEDITVCVLEGWFVTSSLGSYPSAPGDLPHTRLGKNFSPLGLKRLLFLWEEPGRCKTVRIHNCGLWSAA